MTYSLVAVASTALALLANPASIQAPPNAPTTLLGRWETRKIDFTASPNMPEELHHQLLANPQVTDINQAISLGKAVLAVEFKADSTYDFTITRDGEIKRHETGTFTVRQGRLLANSPNSTDGSSFNDQQIKQLARHRLDLTFPLDTGSGLKGVEEDIEYRRVGPYPAEAKK